VLIDIGLPGMSVSKRAAWLRERQSGMQLLMLTVYSTTRHLSGNVRGRVRIFAQEDAPDKLLEAGARCTKVAHPCLRRVRAGWWVVQEDPGRRGPHRYHLTAQESRILRLWARAPLKDGGRRTKHQYPHASHSNATDLRKAGGALQVGSRGQGTPHRMIR